MPVTAGVYEQYISPTPFYTHSVFSGANKGWRKRKAKEKKIETLGARGWNRYSGLLHRGVFFSTTGVSNISPRRNQVSFFLSTTTNALGSR
jgi:hypothetical protein